MSDPKKPPRRSYKFSRLNDVAHAMMDWLGSVQSLIVHTIFFAASFSLILFGFDASTVLLVVTTLVSLEAIYMAIFIQMAVNQNTKSLDAVEEDIDEIQEDVEEIQKDVDEIEKGIDEIEKDVDEIQKDVDVLEKEIPEDTIPEEKARAHLEQVEQRIVKLLGQLEKMKDGGK